MTSPSSNKVSIISSGTGLNVSVAMSTPLIYFVGKIGDAGIKIGYVQVQDIQIASMASKIGDVGRGKDWYYVCISLSTPLDNAIKQEVAK